MDERDAVSAGAETGCLIDQLVPGAPAGGEGGIQIGDPVADMVDAWSAAVQEFRDRAVGGPGLQQFDVRFAEPERHDAGTIGFLRVTREQSEDITIERQRGLDALDGDADVGDAGTVSHGRLVSGGRR